MSTRRVNRLHQIWSGSAAEDHARANAEWLAGVRAMHAAITTLRQAAATAGINYASAIDANRRMWG